MREAIGGTWIFSIVIVFIVLFSSYLALSINYSKAFKVKNGIINIIEKDEGISGTSTGEISTYLSNIGYNVYGSCDTSNGEKGYENSTGEFTTKYKYCVTTISPNTNENNDLPKTYFKVTVFFRIDLPILGSIFVFPITGETKAIYYAKTN
jgi:hypothetical protein